ncbi:LUD domain-containing protein, partial [bacterium]|nr:LUD domain-containing protein [bacterium]
MNSRPDQIKSYIRKALDDKSLRTAVLKATDHSTEKRNEVVAEVPYWEELREQAAIRKDLTLAKLDEYLLQLEENASAKGIQVHWAKDGEDSNRIIADICRESVGAQQIVPIRRDASPLHPSSQEHTPPEEVVPLRPIIAKSKSMTTEEIELTPYLEKDGFEVVETDLGEYIVQIAGQMPSHITAPALHLSRQDVGKLFVEKLGVEYSEDPVELIGIARKVLREKRS